MTVTEGTDEQGRAYVKAGDVVLHAAHELKADDAGRLTLSIIPKNWIDQVLDDPD